MVKFPVRIPFSKQNAVAVTPPDTRRWAEMEIFNLVPDEAVSGLEQVLTDKHFAAGDDIVRQGDQGEEMYLLESGQVTVEVVGEKGEVTFSQDLSAPSMFGEMALVTREPRTATVKAKTDTFCHCVSRASFDDVLEAYPQLSTLLTLVVGERLMEAGTISNVGKNRVLGKLGKGAMATVFAGENANLKKPVALKMLSHALASLPMYVDSFDREARIVAGLSHENIVRVYDMEHAYGTRFIVMEKLEGQLLEDRIREGKPLSWSMIRKILAEVADALAYSHGKGLLHRDIKPSNVFITTEGVAKLLDFGIAVDVDAMKAEKRPQGTPSYMSPEQFKSEPLDARTDLYSLGIMAYEMICREPPFKGQSFQELREAHLHQELPDPRDIVPDVPDDLRVFLFRTTAKEVADRLDSCTKAMQFLRAKMPKSALTGMKHIRLEFDYDQRHAAEVELALRDFVTVWRDKVDLVATGIPDE